MRSFLQRLGDGFRRFMIGRYGSDQLNRFLMVLALVMVVLNMIFGRRTPVFYILVWVLIALTYIRMLSRNITKRYNENTRYLQLKEKVLGFIGSRRKGGSGNFSGFSSASGSTRSAMRSDAEHRIFRCPQCSQRVRVPRGRGKIEISCPKCGKTFIKRT